MITLRLTDSEGVVRLEHALDEEQAAGFAELFDRIGSRFFVTRGEDYSAVLSRDIAHTLQDEDTK